MSTLKVEVYTDGSCSVNSGEGGWGYIVIINGEQVRAASGAATATTNNRMELTAVLEAVAWIKEVFPGELSYNIYTDSAYICNCFKDKWYEKWQVNGWKSATRTAIKNKDLWEPLIDAFLHGEHVFFVLKVAGHSDNYYNNLADNLAREHKEYEETITANLIR